MTATDSEAAAAIDIDRCEKYLDRLLAKTESSKQDLEKNWMAQITAIALGLALVAGLGRAVAHKLLDDPDSYTVLYLILPAVNTFLFVRFGLIAGTFSKARFSAQQLADKIASRRPFAIKFEVSEIYKTNSYFEWAHQEYSTPTMAFLMTIPLVFSLNHALTIYLLYKVVGVGIALVAIAAGYVAICATCYYQYYHGNASNTPVFKGRVNRFIILTALVATVSTLVLLVGLHRYDAQPDRVVFTAR